MNFILHLKIPILVEALKTQQHEINELKKQLNKR